MDATLAAILLIVVLLAVRLAMIAWRLRRAKQDRELDPHALDEARRGLSLHRDLREEAKQEPGRLLQEAKDLSRRPK